MTFIYTRSRACVGCNSLLKDDDFRICLLVAKPLCERCLNQHPSYRLVSVYTTNERYGINYNRDLFPTVQTEDMKFVTCAFLADAAVLTAREVVKNEVLQEMHMMNISINEIIGVSFINTSWMDCEDSESLFSRFVSNNAPTQHSEIYNLCFETIRSGSKDGAFSASLKRVAKSANLTKLLFYVRFPLD